MTAMAVMVAKEVMAVTAVTEAMVVLEAKAVTEATVMLAVIKRMMQYMWLTS